MLLLNGEITNSAEFKPFISYGDYKYSNEAYNLLFCGWDDLLGGGLAAWALNGDPKILLEIIIIINSRESFVCRVVLRLLCSTLSGHLHSNVFVVGITGNTWNNNHESTSSQ